MFLFFSRSCESIGQLSLLLYPSKITIKIEWQKTDVTDSKSEPKNDNHWLNKALIYIKQEERNRHL